MLVDIILKNGSILLNCGIFPEDVKNGDMPFDDSEEIHKAFAKIPWGFKYVQFQNESINGKVHVNNIKEYKIND